MSHPLFVVSSPLLVFSVEIFNKHHFISCNEGNALPANVACRRKEKYISMSSLNYKIEFHITDCFIDVIFTIFAH